jgi:hypothetical protein
MYYREYFKYFKYSEFLSDRASYSAVRSMFGTSTGTGKGWRSDQHE